MSDSQRYHTIRATLKRLFPREPRGNLARYLHTLAALISGIVGSKRTHLPAIAGQVPDGSKRESGVERFSQWIANQRIDFEIYFLPFAEALLVSPAHHTLVLVMDSSGVGRGCLALTVSVVYKKRALVIAWIIAKGSKGHLPEETHVALLERVHALVPEDADVIFLGDGEFDGTTLQAAVDLYGWEYACRTAENTILCLEGEEFTFEDLGPRQRS